MTQIKPVILCGGAGTRLWPLSRKALPKQFAPLLDGKSLLQLTLERLRVLNPEVMCVAAEEHRFLVQEAIDAASVHGTQLLEPVARNTAAAMAIAALLCEPEQLMLFAPADHHIPDAAGFAETVRSGIEAALAGNIVTFGVAPTFPSTGYGYIRQGAALGSDGDMAIARRVDAFIEKPLAADAIQLVLAGGNFWNAGIVLVQASVLVDALQAHAPDILEACKLATAELEPDGSFLRMNRSAFESCRSQSIDYAVLEQCDHVAVVPFLGVWSDVGSWNAVAELYPEDADGNRIHGQGFSVDSRNTFIHAPNRPVVALGTDDLIIVDTPDAVLVAHASSAEHVKHVVNLLVSTGQVQATEHRRVARPWGAYDSVDNGERFEVKRLSVKPGARLSLRMHHHRAEHWVVVKGTARVTRDNETTLLRENESIYIPLGSVYRLENPGKIPLEVIEIQSGSYLGKDDIVRFDDNYGVVIPVTVPRKHA